MQHATPSPFAGKTVMVKLNGTMQPFQAQDWYDRIYPKAWTTEDTTPTSLLYGYRAANDALPLDGEVLYGHIHGLSHLVHISEVQRPLNQHVDELFMEYGIPEVLNAVARWLQQPMEGISNAAKVGKCIEALAQIEE